MDGSLLEIGQVDGDLRQAARFQVHTHGFSIAQPAAREANGFGDLVGSSDIRSIQIDVVGDQEFSCAHDGCPGGGMQPWLAHIGRPVGIGQHFLAQAFELPSADIFKVGAFGPQRRSLVEVDGNTVALPDFAANFLGQHNAVFNCHAFDGDEGNHVGGSQARVCPGVARQVNQLSCFADPAQRGLGYGLGLTGQRDD